VGVHGGKKKKKNATHQHHRKKRELGDGSRYCGANPVQRNGGWGVRGNDSMTGWNDRVSQTVDIEKIQDSQRED